VEAKGQTTDLITHSFYAPCEEKA